LTDELFADEFIRFRLANPPASKGHVQVLPTKNVKSFVELSEEEFIQLFYGASYAATAAFELLGAHGTNIICSDFGKGVVIDVVPRMENDGLNFLWPPVQGNPTELDGISKSVKDKVDELIWAKQNPDAAKKAKQPSEQAPAKVLEEPKEGEVNYLLKSLRRTP